MHHSKLKYTSIDPDPHSSEHQFLEVEVRISNKMCGTTLALIRPGPPTVSLPLEARLHMRITLLGV